MARRYKFTFHGSGEFEGETRFVEAHGSTRPNAERLARARLRDETRRDSSLWYTARVEFVPDEEARR